MKINWIFTFLVFFMFTSAAFAQKREYVYSCGKKTGSVVTVTKIASDGNMNLKININGVESEVCCDRNFRCTSCHMTDKKEDKEITYVLKDGFYYITGKVGNKVIDKKVASKGKPWYQNLSVSSGFICSKASPAQFETFRPFEADLAVMAAHVVGEQKIDGRDALIVRVNPTGAAEKMWHGDYYVDAKDLSLLKYSSIEGVPGLTPLTTWTIK